VVGLATRVRQGKVIRRRLGNFVNLVWTSPSRNPNPAAFLHSAIALAGEAIHVDRTATARQDWRLGSNHPRQWVDDRAKF
jgi:hypothetical protein